MSTDQTQPEPNDPGEDANPSDATPVCLHCIEPVSPLAHVCPHCGYAVGQMTPYLPFESIRWEAGIWGNIWKQLWSHETSIPGKLLRLFTIIVFAPIILLALIPMGWERLRRRPIQ